MDALSLFVFTVFCHKTGYASLHKLTHILNTDTRHSCVIMSPDVSLCAGPWALWEERALTCGLLDNADSPTWNMG